MDDYIYKLIGRNLRNYRLEKGLSQERLAEILGVNLKYIGHVERVERYISLKNLIKLSEILNIDIRKFFDQL